VKPRINLALAVAALIISVIVLGAAGYAKRGLVLGLLPTPPVVVTDRDHGQVVRVLQGQRIAVQLRSNSLSGSVWRPGLVPPFLQLTEATFQPDAKPATAGDGTQTSIFKATEPGQGPLFLNYTDQADQNVIKPARTFSVVVVSQ
jgi:predicted secreted protein